MAQLGGHAVKKAVGDRDGSATINLTASPEANSLLDFQEGNPCAQWTRVVGRKSESPELRRRSRRRAAAARRAKGDRHRNRAD